jgi:hypothetical protein
MNICWAWTRFLAGLLFSLWCGNGVAENLQPILPELAKEPALDCLVLPNPTNSIQFRLYTNASPEARHLFNTFDIQANGTNVLQAPAGEELSRWLSVPTNAALNNLLVNGRGAVLAVTNGSKLTYQAAGPEWSYVAVDVGAAYQGRLSQFKRGILFVEPDLFVIYDHLEASEAADIDFVLHPPAATTLDEVWGDLNLTTPTVGLLVNTPGTQKTLRAWERVDSTADRLLPGTVTMQVGPRAKQTKLDLITVLAVYPPGKRQYIRFRLLANDTAVGARLVGPTIQTIVAFKTQTNSSSGNLTGFQFEGPVGVGIYKPKRSGP